MAKMREIKFTGRLCGFKQNFVKGGSYQIVIETSSDPKIGAEILKSTKHGECNVSVVMDLEEGQQKLDIDEDNDEQMDMGESESEG